MRSTTTRSSQHHKVNHPMEQANLPLKKENEVKKLTVKSLYSRVPEKVGSSS